MQTDKNKYPLWLSITAHSLFILWSAFLYPFKLTFNTPKPILPVYVIQPLKTQQKTSTDVSSKNGILHKKDQHVLRTVKQRKGKIHQHIKDILQTLIDQQTFYPQVAAELLQTGIVIVQFSLLPDGSIHDLTIKKSSGFPLLDEAAKIAVQNISPVGAASIYLHEADNFEIPLQFQL